VAVDDLLKDFSSISGVISRDDLSRRPLSKRHRQTSA
jgi:hypothetical protein